MFLVEKPEKLLENRLTSPAWDLAFDKHEDMLIYLKENENEISGDCYDIRIRRIDKYTKN